MPRWQQLQPTVAEVAHPTPAINTSSEGPCQSRQKSTPENEKIKSKNISRLSFYKSNHHHQKVCMVNLMSLPGYKFWNCHYYWTESIFHTQKIPEAQAFHNLQEGTWESPWGFLTIGGLWWPSRSQLPKKNRQIFSYEKRRGRNWWKMKTFPGFLLDIFCCSGGFVPHYYDIRLLKKSRW